MSNLSNIKLNIKLIVFFFIIFVVSGMISCSKKSDETGGESYNAEMVDVGEDDFTETDEDLLTVDYKEFYDELAPHGEWIEVTDKDVGLELKKGSASGENRHRKISLSELFGVKDARADDVSFGAFFVWQPSPNLAVSVVASEPEPYYVPYTNGQWVYTDAGWYFRAPTPHEEIVHHHGRWVYSPSLGWVWIPGRVWAPAWVEWREHTDYIAWTPIPPSVYIVNNVVVVPPIYPVYEERYVIVERRYFVEPYVYKYKVKKGHFVINDWGRIGGVTVINRTVVNHGPDISVIQTVTSNRIETVKIHKVKNIKNVKYSSNEFDVYSPGFKKAKEKDKISRTITKPKNFERYDNANSKGKRDDLKSSGDKQPGNDNFKNEDKLKNNKSFDDKGRYKEDKSNNNKKRGNDKDMKDGNKNQNFGEDKSKKKDNNKGNDNNKNEKFRKENKDNSNKNDGGKNKEKINDNKKQDKSNDNSKSNDKSRGKNKKK